MSEKSLREVMWILVKWAYAEGKSGSNWGDYTGAAASAKIENILTRHPEEPGLREALENIEHRGCTEDAHIARAALESLAPEEPGLREAWVSANDRLPENDQQVLVFAGGRVVAAEHVLCNGTHEWWHPQGWSCQEVEEDFRGAVIYWMPLPKPPSPVTSKEEHHE